MASRYRVTGELEADKASYRLEDVETGDLSGTVEIGELSAWLRLKNSKGEEIAAQQVTISDTSPLSLQKALRRFLAEERPGESYLFEEVPTDGGIESEALVVSADALFGYDGDEDSESEFEDDSEDESQVEG